MCVCIVLSACLSVYVCLCVCACVCFVYVRVCVLEQAGDILYLLNKEPGMKIMGENTRTGDLGVFPASCVDILVPLP